MGAAAKFDCFVQDLGRGLHDLNSDTLKILLTNTAPNPATDAVLSDITQIGSGTGYTTDGAAVGSNAYSQSAGVATLTGASVVWTATGTMGPFRYAVLYNSTAAAKNLICYWDYGAPLTLTSTQTFTVAFDLTAGLLSVSIP
jgi:hypothetical protein